MPTPWGGSGSFNAYGANMANIDLGLNYNPFGSIDNYWNNPISSNTMDAMKDQFQYSANPGAGASSAASNPFSTFGSALGKAAGGFGSAPSASSQFNSMAMIPAMAGLAAFRDSQERQVDYGWQKLSNDMANRLSADKWFKYGPLFEQQAQNIEERAAIGANILRRKNEAEDARYGQSGYSQFPRLLGLGKLPY